MNPLQFRHDRDANRPLNFTPRRMVNLGYVGRDQKAVRAHIDELAHEGVPPPHSIPLFIPLPLNSLTMESEIQVVGPSTSGEVEVAFLIDGERIHIAVGSDHTDRAMERTSVALSKGICPNVIGQTVWDFTEVSDHWDELILRSFVRRKPDDAEIPYQSAALGSLMSAKDLIDFALARMDADGRKGLVLYSGTVPVLTGGFIYGSHFRGELFDKRRNRTLSCSYQVTQVAEAWNPPQAAAR